MSEENTTQAENAPAIDNKPEVSEASTPGTDPTPPSAAVKKAVKKKKPAKKAATKKVVKRLNLGKAAKKEVDPDSPRFIAKHGKDLTTAQVRMLQALSKQRKPIDRQTLKVAGGWPATWQYGKEWSGFLWDLDKRKLIRISDEEVTEGRPHHQHVITPKGKEVLEAAVKAAKEAFKEMKK